MAEDRKPDDRIAPRAPRTAGEAAAPLEVRDEKPLAHGGEVEEAAPPREDEAARPCLDGAGEHAAEAPRAKRAPLSAAQKVGVGVAAALSVALANHVEQVLITALRPNVLHLDSPPLLDDLVGLGLKLHHRRQVGRDGVCGPNFGMHDPVKWPSKFLNRSQTSQRILVS